jgi:glycosyltransferase involved in cell wall biosynthesis
MTVDRSDDFKALAQRSFDPRLNVVRLVGNVGLSGVRNIGIRRARGKYVFILDADDLIHPRFISTAVEALENNPEFDVVICPAGYFDDSHHIPLPGEPLDFMDYAVFSGEAVVAGIVENRFASATSLFRTEIFAKNLYDESLSCYEDWSLYLRLCDAGIRFIVATNVFFYYRKRSSSMVHSLGSADARVAYCDLMRTSAPAALKERSRYLISGIALVSGIASPGAASFDRQRLDEILSSTTWRIVSSLHPLFGLLPSSMRREARKAAKLLILAPGKFTQLVRMWMARARIG